MKKQSFIRFYTENHEELYKSINKLNKAQMEEIITLGNWTVKDILAHISAWNFELNNAINQILKNEKPWFVDEEELNEAEFNQRETQKRKRWSVQSILNEWENSFEELIERIKDLSNTELEYQADFFWKDTSIPVSIKTLLDYTYEGEGHEGGHAKQINEYFKNK